jgi:Ca-activated chloride channel family protein
LSDYNHLQPGDESIAEIVQLGKSYNLLTEYTSFIAIDSEVINAGGKQTSIKQPLPLPEGVSDLAIGGNGYLTSSSGKKMKSLSYNAPVSADCAKLSKEEIVYEPEVSSAEMVEIQPIFLGGDLQTFKKYIEEHLVYPEEARKNKISGRVFVQFVVDEQGKITEVKLVRGVNELLDNEAIRIIKNSPKWSPGTINGQPQKTSLVVIVEFKL